MNRLFKYPIRHVVIFIKAIFHTLGLIIIRPFIGNPNFQILDRTKAYKILYVCLAFRGDLILNFPAISALRRHFPNSKIVCWVRGFNEPLAKMSSAIDEVIIYDDFSNNAGKAIFDFITGRGDRNFENSLRGFNIYIDDSGYGFSAVAGFRADIPYRIGRNFQGFGFLYHAEVPLDFDMQLIERRLKLLQPLGENLSLRDIPKPYIKINGGRLREALKEFNIVEHDYFSVQPYAGWEAKNWGIDKYCIVAKRFSAHSGLTPVFIGSETERQIISESIKKFQVAAINIAGLAEIEKSAIIVGGARIHLGGDSVGGHVAAAMGTKSVTIFGPTNPLLSAYLGGINIGVFKRTSCTPKPDKIYCCFDAGRSCPHISCMRELGENEVLGVLIDLLAGKPILPVVEFLQQ